MKCQILKSKCQMNDKFQIEKILIFELWIWFDIDSPFGSSLRANFVI